MAVRAPVGPKLPMIGPSDFFKQYTGPEVPDPITFIVSPEYCNRPNLYPRQATLLKIIFLRDDLFTQYDNDVIDGWEASYAETGWNGIVPNIRWKIKWLKARGYKWFREVLLVMGRRAGKGHISGLCLSYVLWNYMAKGDPQGYYGVDRDKKLACMVFAGKREQAKAMVWKDTVNVITGAPCFAPYINQLIGEKLSVYAPYDFVRMKRLAARGINAELDMATFEIVPKESTMMAGRGPTSFAQAYDEMAHVVAAGANRSAEEVYQAATPSLDQFGKDGFIIEPSSPWQMMGQFYENYKHSIEIDEETGEPAYPEILMIQLRSWDIYEDWERAYSLPLFPPGFEGDLGEYVGKSIPRFQPLRGAIQTYDEQMVKLKRANPETFAVERESKFATALDAYFNETKIKEIFEPWEERPESNGPPSIVMQREGRLVWSYKGHADPSKVNDKFGLCVGHTEYDATGRAHAVIDLLHHWDPADFEDGIIDYETVDDWIWENVMLKFYPDEFTFDQYNSTSSIQKLQKRVRGRSMPKHVQVFGKTTTRAYDWSVKENTKAAMNLGLIHSPYYEQLDLELRFMQLVNGRVDHPSAGPVQSKDVADAFCEVIHTLIGEQVNNFLHGDLKNLRPGGTVSGGIDPFSSILRPEDEDKFRGLSGFNRSRGERLDGFGRRQAPRGPRPRKRGG